MNCPCQQPGYCPEYGLRLVGRLWQLCNDPTELGEKYRKLWSGRVHQAERPQAHADNPCCVGTSFPTMVQCTLRDQGNVVMVFDQTEWFGTAHWLKQDLELHWTCDTGGRGMVLALNWLDESQSLELRPTRVRCLPLVFEYFAVKSKTGLAQDLHIVITGIPPSK